jgi:hypothetical protein
MSNQELGRVLLIDTWRDACESQHTSRITLKDNLIKSIAVTNIALITDFKENQWVICKPVTVSGIFNKLP